MIQGSGLKVWGIMLRVYGVGFKDSSLGQGIHRAWRFWWLRVSAAKLKV